MRGQMQRLLAYGLGLGLCFAFLLNGIQDLRFSNYHWLEEDNPARLQQEFSNSTFKSGESLLLLVQLSDSFFNQRYFDELASIQEELADQLDGITIRSPLKTSFAHTYDDGSIAFIEYGTALAKGYLTEESFRASFQESSAWGQLVAKDERSFLVVVEKDIGEDSIERNKIKAATESVFGNSTHFQTTTSAGAMHLNYELDRSSIANIKLYTPMVFFIVLVLLFLFYRRVQEPVIILINCLLAMLIALMGSRLFGYPITAISLSLPITIMVIATADSIFILNQWRRNYQMPLRQRMWATLRQLWLPCFYVSVTTAVGFGSFSFSSIVPLREFGILSFFSIVIASTFVVLNSVIASGALNPNAVPEKEKQSVWSTIGEYALRYRVGVLLITAAVVVGSMAGYSYYRTETNFLDVFFKKESTTYQTFSLIDDNLSGTGQIQLVLPSDEEGHFRNIDTFSRLVAMQDQLTALPEVTYTTSMREPIAVVHKAFTNKSESLPANQSALAQDILFLEFSRSDLENDALQPYVDFDFKNARVVIQTKNQSSDKTKVLREKIDKIVAQHFPEYFLTGPSIYFQSLSALVIDTQYQSFIITGVINFFIFLAHFPLLLALIGSLATIIPTVVVIGVICWSRVPFDFSTVLIGSISEGLVIDMVIHFMFHQRYHRASTLQTLSALGAPITWTIILLSTGFAVFAGSDLVVLQRFGIFNTISLVFALLTTLIFLPALMSYLDKSKVANQHKTSV